MTALIAYADGLDGPRSRPTEVAAAAGLANDDVEVLLGWTPEHKEWLDDPALRGTTILAGYALAGAVGGGRLRYLPLRLSAVPSFVSRRAVAVGVVTGVRRGDELVFGASVGWGAALAHSAQRVVVEIDEEGLDLGGPVIEGNIVATVPRPPPAVPLPRSRPPTDVDRAIAAHVAALLPERATLQFGPGGVAEAIVSGLDRPVQIWSGLVIDAVADLDRHGLLDGTATGAYAWGGTPLADLASRGRLVLRPVEETHDVGRLTQLDRFVACNTALQVGLDGSVNVERVGERVVAGIGGHADFSFAASRSEGGLSIISLAATTRSGASTIVPRVECVSTPRCDVDVVVTEHGVADLRGLDDGERAARMMSIAAPVHRDALAASVRVPE